MNGTSRSRRWEKEVIDEVMRLHKLKKLTRSRAKVIIHPDPKLCKRCKRRSRVFVSQGAICGKCWSKTVIKNWKPPK